MEQTLSRNAPSGGKTRGRGRPESALRIDAETVMNAIAALDDAIRTAANARRALVAGIAHYEIPNGPRGPKRAA